MRKVVKADCKTGWEYKTGAVVKEKGLTFWQKIDRLILRTRNSNH